MSSSNVAKPFATLSAPLIADACVRLKLPVRAVPPGLRPLKAGARQARTWSSPTTTARISAGETLRAQLRFAGFLERRAAEPHLTFRAWLREMGGAIEE